MRLRTGTLFPLGSGFAREMKTWDVLLGCHTVHVNELLISWELETLYVWEGRRVYNELVPACLPASGSWWG